MLLPLAAAAGVISGLAWTAPAVDALENRAAAAINGWTLPRAVDQAVAAARPLGSKWAWLAALAIMILADRGRGFWLIPAALAAAAVERGLKAVAGRPRPYRAQPAIVLRQSPAPTDSGFPSGDAMRAWFVTTALGCGLPAVPGWALGLAILAAVLVSLGRVRLGAHYPLDVWAGGWIGIGFAAVTAGLAA